MKITDLSDIGFAAIAVMRVSRNILSSSEYSENFRKGADYPRSFLMFKIGGDYDIRTRFIRQRIRLPSDRHERVRTQRKPRTIRDHPTIESQPPVHRRPRRNVGDNGL